MLRRLDQRHKSTHCLSVERRQNHATEALKMRRCLLTWPASQKVLSVMGILVRRDKPA